MKLNVESLMKLVCLVFTITLYIPYASPFKVRLLGRIHYVEMPFVLSCLLLFHNIRLMSIIHQIVVITLIIIIVTI